MKQRTLGSAVSDERGQQHQQQQQLTRPAGYDLEKNVQVSKKTNRTRLFLKQCLPLRLTNRIASLASSSPNSSQSSPTAREKVNNNNTKFTSVAPKSANTAKADYPQQNNVKV